MAEQDAGAMWSFFGGFLLGLAYAVTGYTMNRRALGSPERFVHWVVGGTVLRMMAVMLVVAAAITLLPVRRTVFLGTFFLILFVAMAVEITILHRRQIQR